MSDEFIEPTREIRRKLLLLIALFLLAGATLKFWLMPAFFAHIDSLPRCDQVTWLRATLICLMAIPPLLACWAVPQAISLLKHNQFPLPGTWVFQRTQIKRGRPVLFRAYSLLLLAVISLAFPLASWHLLASTPIFAPAKSCT